MSAWARFSDELALLVAGTVALSIASIWIVCPIELVVLRPAPGQRSTRGGAIESAATAPGPVATGRRTRGFAWVPSPALGVLFGAGIGAYVALPATGLFLMVNMAGLALVAAASVIVGLPVAVAGLLLAARSSTERVRHGLRLVALRAFLAPLLVVAAAAESYAITRTWISPGGSAAVGGTTFRRRP